MEDIELEKKAKLYAYEHYDDTDEYGYWFSDMEMLRRAYIAGAKEIQEENKQLQEHNKYVLDLIEAERRIQEECNDVHLKNIATLDKENVQLKQQLKNEKQLNTEIKKRLVEVEYDCDEYNHEYCDPNCNGKRKETVDLYQLVSDGLNETLLKQKDEEIKRLEKENEQLKQHKKTMKECHFNGCLVCANKDCEAKK